MDTTAPGSPSSTIKGCLKPERKPKGKLARLAERLTNGEAIHGRIGVGHTRWATHGRPSDANAHPHMDCTDKIAVVHNGIIENYGSLRADLLARGHVFKSETDTEVLSHLIEEQYDGDLPAAVRLTLAQVRGAYALGVISSDSPGKLIFARNGASPLVVGVGDGEMIVASDTPAILQYTRKVIVLREGELVEVGRDGFALSAFDGTPIERDVEQVMWDASSAEKAGFKHFMLKEIFEQPNVVKETLAGRIDESDDVQLGAELGIHDSFFRAMTKISITGCGTAYHAGMVGMYLMRALCKLPVEMELASEFRYGDRLMDPRTLTIAMSQSGETADERSRPSGSRKTPVHRSWASATSSARTFRALPTGRCTRAAAPRSASPRRRPISRKRSRRCI